MELSVPTNVVLETWIVYLNKGGVLVLLQVTCTLDKNLSKLNEINQYTIKRTSFDSIYLFIIYLITHLPNIKQ